MTLPTYPVYREDPALDALHEVLQAQQALLQPIIDALASSLGGALSEQERELSRIRGRLTRGVNGRLRSQNQLLQQPLDQLGTAIQSGLSEQQVGINRAMVTLPGGKPVPIPEAEDGGGPVVPPFGPPPPESTPPGQPPFGPTPPGVLGPSFPEQVPLPELPGQPPSGGQLQPQFPALPPGPQLPPLPGGQLQPTFPPSPDDIVLFPPQVDMPPEGTPIPPGGFPFPGVFQTKPLPKPDIGTPLPGGLQPVLVGGGVMPPFGGGIPPGGILEGVTPRPPIGGGITSIPRPPPPPPPPPPGCCPPATIIVEPPPPPPPPKDPPGMPGCPICAGCYAIANRYPRAVYTVPWGLRSGEDASPWSDCGDKQLDETLARIDNVGRYNDVVGRPDWILAILPLAATDPNTEATLHPLEIVPLEGEQTAEFVAA